MSRNEGRKNSCRFFPVEVFQMVVMQEQAAGEKRKEGGDRQDAELWAVSILGQGIQKSIVDPVNLKWDFLAG